MKTIIRNILFYFRNSVGFAIGYIDRARFWYRFAKKIDAQHIEKQKELEKEVDRWKTELYKLVAYMTDGTWKDGDNMVETIDAHQADMYLAVHRDGVIDILMNEPDPEIAAQDLFEYFGIQDINGTLQPKE